MQMNELPVIGSLCYAQRVLGWPRGKQRYKEMHSEKIDLASKKTIF